MDGRSVLVQPQPVDLRRVVKQVAAFVSITINPTGDVLAQAINSSQDSVGAWGEGCIEGAVRSVHVRPFVGRPITVGREVGSELGASTALRR